MPYYNPNQYEGILKHLFGPGGTEAYVRQIAQQMGTQTGMATMPYFQQYLKQYAGGLSGRGGLGSGAQPWAVAEGFKGRSGQMIGAVAGATGTAQRDVLAAKQGLLQQLIMVELQKYMAEQQRKGAMWSSFGEILGAIPQAAAAYYGGKG